MSPAAAASLYLAAGSLLILIWLACAYMAVAHKAIIPRSMESLYRGCRIVGLGLVLASMVTTSAALS